MSIKKHNIRYYTVISYLVLFCCFIGTITYIRFNNYKTLDADESSELLLGKILSEENSIVTKNWYYSTELRVINANLIYSFFFHLTNNWHQVRTFSLVSMYLLILAAYYFMSRLYHLEKFFAFSASILIIPYSDLYFKFVLKGAQYINIIVINFFTLALSELFVKESEIGLSKGRAGKWVTKLSLFSFILAGLVGLSGYKQVFFTYLPLFLSSGMLVLLEENNRNIKNWFIFSCISFSGSLLGCLINVKILSQIYSFLHWDSINFTKFDIQRLNGIINGFFNCFGYVHKNVFSVGLISNLASVGWITITIFGICYAIRNRNNVRCEFLRLSVFTLCSYTIFIALYLFTNMSYSEFYSLPIVSLSFPLVSILLEQVNWRKSIRSVIFAVLILCTVLSGTFYYLENKNYDVNEEIRKITKFLVSEGYYNGYSTFWFGNQLTELSNGKIDVWVHMLENRWAEDSLLKITDIDETFHWLQKVSHDSNHPAGKTFILFTDYGFENNNWKEHLYDDDIVYQSENFIIMGYNSYEKMINILYPGYEFDFTENYWAENNQDIDGRRELYYAGVSHGPYKTFWPGTYDVIVKGENLADSELYCISDYGKNIYSLDLVERNNNISRYLLKLPEKAYNFESIVRNISDDVDSVVVLDSISIRKRGN